MNLIKKYTNKLSKDLITFSIIGILCACNGGSGSDGSTNNPVSLGVLDNGSSVQSSAGNFTVSAGETTSGSIGLSGGTPGYTGILTMAISGVNTVALTTLSTLPTITMNPTTCTLISGNSNDASCQFTINTSSNIANGTYTITPTFTPTSGTPLALNGITLTVDHGAIPTAGNLSIILDNSTLTAGESTNATVTLSDSIGVSNLVVAVASSSPNVLNITPTTCNLTTESNSCRVHIDGLASGSGTISAAANGYTTATSDSITVNSAVVPGNLSVTIESTALQYGESTTATITLNDSESVNDLVVSLNTDNSDIATINPSSCHVSSTNNTCHVTINAGDQTGAATITTSADGYISTQNILQVSPMPGTLSFNVATPNLMYGESSIATVTLNGSRGVSQLLVTINSESPDVALVNPDYCMVSSTNDTCNVTISAGNYTAATNIIATANGYTQTVTNVSAESVVHHAYVTNNLSNTISMYSLNSTTGELAMLNPATVNTMSSPYGIVTSRLGNYAYVVNNGSNTVGIYAIDPVTGVLGIPQYVATESSPYNIVLDPSNRYAYVVNYKSNSVSMYSVNPQNGTLQALSPASVATESGPRAIAIDPNGKYAYVSNLHSSTISMYSLESTTGQLTPLSPAAVEAPAEYPDTIAMDPFGKYIYVAAVAINMYSIDSNTGILDGVYPYYQTGEMPSGMVINSTGQYLYTADRTGYIRIYYIDKASGRLQEWQLLRAGHEPRGVSFDPSGNYFYAVNNDDNNISMYKIYQPGFAGLTPLTESKIATESGPYGIAFN